MYFEFTTKLNRKEMEAQKSRQKAFRVIVVEEHDILLYRSIQKRLLYKRIHEGNNKWPKEFNKRMG